MYVDRPSLRCRDWGCNYPHSSRETARFAEEDPEGNLIIRIKYFYSMFALATCRDSEELPSDRFMDDFKDALDSVEQYLAVVDRRSSVIQTSSTHEQPNQSMFFGFSILPTLNLIAHKFRDSLLRRRALHLLFTAQKQEGLEYSGALSMYTTSAIEIEEHRGFLLAQQSTEWHGQSVQPILPEQARIADCVVTGQGARGIYKLTCARYLHERSEPQQVELTQYEGGAVPLRLVISWMIAVQKTFYSQHQTTGINRFDLDLTRQTIRRITLILDRARYQARDFPIDVRASADMHLEVMSVDLTRLIRYDNNYETLEIVNDIRNPSKTSRCIVQY
jgi:hypothetical protein